MTATNLNIRCTANAHLWQWEDDQSELNEVQREALTRLIFEGSAHLIGEAPPESMHPGDPIWQRHSPMYPYPPRSAGGRLHRISDYGLGMYIHGVQRQNLMPVYEARWNKHGASDRAKEFMNRFKPAHVILCGRKVCDAFGLEGITLPQRHASWLWHGCTFYAIPHPSGANPQSRIPANQEIVRGYFAEVRELVAWRWAYFYDLRKVINGEAPRPAQGGTSEQAPSASERASKHDASEAPTLTRGDA